MESLLERLSQLPPKQPEIKSLAQLVEALYESIGEMKQKGYSWQDIADALNKECDFEALPNTVRDSYSRVSRKRQAKTKRKKS